MTSPLVIPHPSPWYTQVNIPTIPLALLSFILFLYVSSRQVI